MALADLVAHITAQESDRRLDPRVARVVAKLDKAPDGLSAVAVLGLALAGRSLTEAALAAGFADSAHFARLHRETFGVAASQTLRRVARAGRLAQGRLREGGQALQ